MGHGSKFPRPPGKYVTEKKKRRRWKNTELHDAFTSFGRKDRTSRLSEGELCSQAFREAGYFARCGTRHFMDAIESIASIFS